MSAPPITLSSFGGRHRRGGGQTSIPTIICVLLLSSPKGNLISSRKNVPTHQSGGVGDGLGPAVREGDLVGAGGSGAVPVLVGSEVHQAGVVLHIEIFGRYSKIEKY